MAEGRHMMWTEKYRPRTLDEIRDQAEIVSRLKKFVEDRSMPHCLFAGPPGTGKTTAALCLAHDLFGERFMDLFMELNASDERGIDVIRTTVKEFARAATISDAPFKILVLDEADNMTSDAQQALRRTMERYTDTCRFILCCNYSSKIIEPIQSRCAIFRFSPVGEDEVKDFLGWIAKNEGVNITDGGLAAIARISEGDLRKAINLLQAASSLKDEIDEDSIYRLAGRIEPRYAKEILELAMKGNFSESRKRLRDLLLEKGLSPLDIIRQIHGEIFRSELQERDKLLLAEMLGEADFRISQGGDPEVQMSAFLAKLASLSSRPRG
ncbi:MAG: replication factor C small subunit [Candidatus Bathyarchaeia archaeon]